MINVPSYLRLTDSGLSITDSSIKFVTLKQNPLNSELTLKHCEEILLPAGTIQSGFIQNEEGLTKILKDLASRHSLSYVNASLPEERAYIFNATIDRVPEEGLRDAVAFIIEENAPVSLANSVFDFEVMENVESNDKINVTVSVISKKVVDFYLQVLGKVGITPISFDLESQAIARAIIPNGKKSVKLIIDLGREKIGYYVVRDGVVQFTTTLANDSNLKTEMEKILTFWSSRSPNTPIESVLVSGVRSSLDTLIEELKSLTPLPLTLAEPWTNVTHLANVPFACEPLNIVSAIGAAIPH